MTEALPAAGCSTLPNESPHGPEQDGPFMRTYPECSVPMRVPTLLQWLEKWLGPNLTYQKTNGETPALLLDREDLSNGLLWTRSTSEHRSSLEPSRNAEGVSSLSEILETGQVDRRYFLSQKACAGILRRAEKRGKRLPPMLHRALSAVATEPATRADKTL